MKKICLLAVFLLGSLGLFAQKPTATFSHVGLEVRDLDKTVAFYSSLFHFDTMANPFPGRRIKWFKIGPNLQLHLIEDTAKYISQENFHIAFSVTSINDFIAVLKSKHIPYYDSDDKPYSVTTRPDGVKQVYFKDPDGNEVEANDAN